MLQQGQKTSMTRRIPPHVFFFVSAVFHYLGPSFAVLLFSGVSVLGVAWFRIASAAVVFAVWRRPWCLFALISWAKQRTLLALGMVLGLMNACFYLAIARLPLGTVGSIEFLGPIALAALGARTRRNVAALLLAVGGVWLLTDVRFGGQPLGFLFAFANCVFFMLYVLLGHRIAQDGGSHAHRAGDDYPAGVGWCAASHDASTSGSGWCWRGDLLVGHSLRLRSIGHGSLAAGHVRTAPLAAPCVRYGDWRRGASPDSQRS